MALDFQWYIWPKAPPQSYLCNCRVARPDRRRKLMLRRRSRPVSSLLTGQAVPMGEITGQQFDATFDLNVRGTLFTVQKAWRPFTVFCEFTDIFCVETV
jgi:hypothetical protein